MTVAAAVFSIQSLLVMAEFVIAQYIPPIVQPSYPSTRVPRGGFGRITDLVAFGDSYTDEGRRQLFPRFSR